MASSTNTQVREGWQELPLIECTSDRQILNGVVQPGFPVSDGVPIVRVNNLANGRIITHDSMRIAPEIDYAHRRTKLRGGEIVLSLVGTTGSVAIVPDELSGWNVARAIAVIRPAKNIGAAWLKLCLGSSYTREYLDARANTTVQKTLNLKDVKQLPIPLPPPHWRQEILSLILPIGDAITNLENQNQSLEAVARAIFKSWFVDFDPVRAKAEGREPEGMDAATAALFPSRMQESYLGKIPMGWSVQKVEDVAEKVAMGPFGSSIKVETFVPSGVPVISGNHLRTFMLDDNSYNFISEEHAQRLARAMVSPGDIVFTHAGNIGSVSIIPQHSRYSRYVVSQRQFFLRCDSSEISAKYIVLYFTSKEGRHKLLANSSSVGVPSIARPVTYLRSIELLVPEMHVLHRFDDVVGPIFDSFEQNRIRIQTLSEIRDTLLPRLISGKLRVPEAEAMLSEVV